MASARPRVDTVPMSPTLSLRHKIAQRLDVLLLRELGQGIDPLRMLAQPLYARDVLLVCDALRGSDLAMLAQQFRDATEQDELAASQPGALWPDSSSGPPSRWPASWLGALRRQRQRPTR
jgi:hypothetical protein